MLQWLESQSVHILRELARRRGASEHAVRKTELVAELVGLLTDPKNVLQAIAGLSDGERATLEIIYLLAAQEGIRKDRVQKALLAWYGPLFAKDVESYLRNLAASGLLFVNGANDPLRAEYRLPRAVSGCLSSLVKPVAVATQQELAAVTVREIPAADLLQALSLFWQYVKENEVRVRSNASIEAQQDTEPATAPASFSREHLPAWIDREQLQGLCYVSTILRWQMVELQERDRDALLELTGSDPERLDFLYHLLLSVGLITRAGDVISVNELAMDRYRRHGEIQQLQALTAAWLGMEQWAELGWVLRQQPRLKLRSIQTADLPADLLHDLAEIRRFFTRLLSMLADEQWHRWDSLLAAIWELGPDVSCLRSGALRELPVWWLGESGADSPALIYERSYWMQRYGPLFAAFLAGPLHWLGSVSLAYEGARLVAFRLTTLGKYLLGRYPQTAAKGDMRPLTVSDDLTVSVQLGRVDAEVHDFLGQFSDLIDAEPDMFRYCITPQRLNQAFEAGVELKRIVSFLEQVSGAALPDGARAKLEAYWRTYGTVRLYRHPTIIEFADDYALQELLNTTSLAEYVIYQLSPRVVVIKSEAADLLRGEMIKKGYTPRVKESK